MKAVFISRERLSLLITKRSSDNTTTQMVMITVDSQFHNCVTFFSSRKWSQLTVTSDAESYVLARLSKSRVCLPCKQGCLSSSLKDKVLFCFIIRICRHSFVARGVKIFWQFFRINTSLKRKRKLYGFQKLSFCRSRKNVVSPHAFSRTSRSTKTDKIS